MKTTIQNKEKTPTPIKYPCLKEYDSADDDFVLVYLFGYSKGVVLHSNVKDYPAGKVIDEETDKYLFQGLGWYEGNITLSNDQ